MQVKKVPDQVASDGASVRKVTNDPLIKQFNEARHAKSAIDRFIGLFKILEDLYGGRPAKSSFKRSSELNEIALRHLEVEEAGAVRPITQPEFEKLVEDLVDIRNQCAHRTPDGYGITHGDARVEKESVYEDLAVTLKCAYMSHHLGITFQYYKKKYLVEDTVGDYWYALAEKVSRDMIEKIDLLNAANAVRGPRDEVPETKER